MTRTWSPCTRAARQRAQVGRSPPPAPGAGLPCHGWALVAVAMLRRRGTRLCPQRTREAARPPQGRAVWPRAARPRPTRLGQKTCTRQTTQVVGASPPAPPPPPRGAEALRHHRGSRRARGAAPRHPSCRPARAGAGLGRYRHCRLPLLAVKRPLPLPPSRRPSRSSGVRATSPPAQPRATRARPHLPEDRRPRVMLVVRAAGATTPPACAAMRPTCACSVLPPS
mmetsp:Transcript_6864/g.18579  ORF Transcript_6864/g.18579 Transcript_6864/m.18579 type:complete len:225 (+) Transcript_6864:2517-3191(+)